MSIRLSHVSFSYAKRAVLKNVSLNIPHGTWVGVIGPNGGGKTTLLKLLMGLLSPQEGSIELLGKSPPEIRTKIGYVPQQHLIDRSFPISVKELVSIGLLHNHPYRPKKDLEKTRYYLDLLGLLSYEDAPFASLSGGMAQRALLARALLCDPEILLLDEPTANIDPPSSQRILELLSSFQKKKTIFLVTHDLSTILERVDQMLSVQGEVLTLKPAEVCEHFALGLYHTPLRPQQIHHLKTHASCSI